MSMAWNDVLYREERRTGVITLNRPERKNMMTTETYRERYEALQ